MVLLWNIFLVFVIPILGYELPAVKLLSAKDEDKNKLRIILVVIIYE